MQITVNTGAMTIDVMDEKKKKIGEFDFIPTDMDIVRRCEDVIEYFNKMEIVENATHEEILVISDKIKEQFDYLLNGKVADGIFRQCNPLTVNGKGDFFFESVMEGIAGLIESTMETRINKKLEKIRKATAKYHK